MFLFTDVDCVDDSLDSELLLLLAMVDEDAVFVELLLLFDDDKLF